MKINCDFTKGLCTIYLGKYTCTVSSAAITKNNTRIKAFDGVHCPGRSNSDVAAIKFENTIVEHFPRGLNKFFPNLESLFIRNCGLKTISRKDLIGLENLTGLSIFSNQLTSLPNDLFVNMPKLKNISFVGNNLEAISSKLFIPILDNELTYVDFRHNVNISSVYGASGIHSVNTMEQLMEVIDSQCVKPSEDRKYSKNFAEIFTAGLKQLWKSQRLSDFTINVGAEKFAVHKSVLVVQSSVFANIFTSKVHNEMTLTDFGAIAVKEFLLFIYTGEIPDDANSIELFSLAANYDVRELRAICEEMVLRNLDESNAMEVFDVGHNYNSQALKARAFEEIQSMFPDILREHDLVNNRERVKELIAAKLQFDNVLYNNKK